MQYPSNVRIYDKKYCSRMKWAEHGHGLLPSCFYPGRIESLQKDLDFWLERKDAGDFTAAYIRRAKWRLTRAKTQYQRALRWDAWRDQQEAKGLF